MNIRGLELLDLERIPNNLRMQEHIKEELEKVKNLLATKKADELSNETLSKIGLAYLESGQYKEAKNYFSKALTQESQSPKVMALCHF